MKSTLRIIVGVLVCIVVIIGIIFVTRLFFKPSDVSYAKVNYVARCTDNAVYLASGIAVIFLMPLQIRRKLEAGTITEEKAKKVSRLVWPLGCVCIGMGILRVIGFLP